VKLNGENQIVYASDFPHWDHSWPASIDEIRQRGDINDAHKRKILADNARRLYKL
jgi:predicted TIM-barrel fold metal-dependent hydrolase